MAHYKIINDTFDLIKEKPFTLEKQVQKLTEKNLDKIFGLEFIKTEHTVHNYRIDTLAFDHENHSFVIIEYKRDKNFSVIDQGYAYLSLLLNNKSDFVLEYNECGKGSLKRDDVDWSQSRVVFVAPSFTSYQQEAINFKDLPIELWEVKKYENDTVTFNQIKTNRAQESVKTISRHDATAETVNKEIRVYTEQEHIEYGSEETKELYEKVKAGILNFAGIDLKPNKYYLAFIGDTNIVDVSIQKKTLKLWVNLPKGRLDDPKQITRDVSKVGHWGNGDYEIQIANDENLEYILSLIKQSYNENK